MNYKIYKDASQLMEEIEIKAENTFKDTQSNIFSEVLIILDNDQIENQINIIRERFKNNKKIKLNPHLNPFLVLISPKELDLTKMKRE